MVKKSTAKPSVAQETLALLEALEAELKAQQLWDDTMPEPSRLMSTQPFASDTLEFYQWLQFIMIPSLRQCVEQRKPLPNKIAVSPMTVEVWKGKLKEHRQIILVLKTIDELLDGHHGRH